MQCAILVSPQTLALRDKPPEAAPPIPYGASNYVTGCEKGCGFLTLHYLEVKLY